MHINSINDQTPFTTKDGSTITSILDESNAPVKNQSLAEATLPAKGSTQRHYHKKSEEFYYLLEGEALMEIDGATKKITGIHFGGTRLPDDRVRHRHRPY